MVNLLCNVVGRDHACLGIVALMEVALSFHERAKELLGFSLTE